MIQPTVTTNWPEFNRQLTEVAQHSSRTYPQVVNGQALAFASRAIRATEKANVEQIAVELGQIATQRRVSKKGKVSYRRIFRTDLSSLAHILVNWRRKKAGENMLWGDELDAKAKRLIGGRLRAVAFIKSGWIYAIRTLSAAVGYGDRRDKLARGETAKMSGQPKGYARPAKTAISSVVTCEIANTALISHDGRNPLPVAERGTQKAMAETIADMRRHLEEKLGKVLKQYSAR